MSALILPNQKIVSWFDMVSPRDEEMPGLLRLAGNGWRTPKRKWEDLWRLRRGEFNHILGMRRFSGPKFQRGSVSVWCAGTTAAAALGDTQPTMQDITNSESQVAPTAARNQLGWDSDGSVRYYFGTELANVVWADLTTQSDDANDHTNDWWPDQPSTNEGLNWDIRYLNETTGGTGGTVFYFHDGTSNRTTATWYLLDTVSNDMASASRNGAIVLNRANGTAKTPNTGTATLTVDVEIRATGSGSAVASSALDLTSIGT